MNPILLKPEGGRRSQLILRGKVHGTLSAGGSASALDYWPIVTASLDRLRASYDVVVAEGAGSPAEMNLRDRDVANMRVALHARAAVLLVGDVERGGVFAQIIGTLDLLPNAERELVQGLIVNRFHGDRELFAEGVSFLERHTGCPVFGVVPFVRDLDLDEEDAAVLDRRRPVVGVAGAALRIGVIHLPHLANFDDFGPLERHPSVSLTYLDRPEQLADLDLIVVPGSKATSADLRFLRERGIADSLVAARRRGTPIVGICGGFQMLGTRIDDPDGVESADASVPGLALLPHRTTFAMEKLTRRVRARLTASHGPFAAIRGLEIGGYEIHAGRSALPVSTAGTAPLRIVDRSGDPADEPDGGLSDDGLVFGTYLHGLFANAAVTESLVAWLSARRSAMGRAAPTAYLGATTIGDPHDRWADALEAALDLPRLFACCGIALPGRTSG